MRKLFLGVLAAFLLTGLLAALTAPESIDEYSLDYWSSRVASDFLAPQRALKMEPVLDEQMGYLGFLRSGHFVYNRSLDEIAAGEPYSITPMIHFLPLYMHALPKLLFGDHVFYFTHVLLVTLSFLLPMLHYWRRRERRFPYAAATMVLLTPAVAVNITYSMSDAVGLFGVSLFSYALFVSEPHRGKVRTVLTMACLAVTPLMAVFFKPVGWVLLPWCLALVIMMPRLKAAHKSAVIATILFAVSVASLAADRRSTGSECSPERARPADA